MMVIPVFIQMIEDPEDQEWMIDIYTQYYKLMLVTAEYYLDNYMDVEEIVNDSVLALYEKIDRIRRLEPKALTSYIITTVRNAAFGRLRKLKLLNHHFLYLSDYSMETIATTEDVGKIVESKDQLDEVHKIINTLSEKEQSVIRLRFEMGLNDQEIAEELGISQEAVRQNVSRARKHIHEALLREEVRA